MMIYSMTGYASRHIEVTLADGPQVSLGVELRSVNSRFLDIYFKMPEECRVYEVYYRQLITQAFKRGKIEIKITIDSSASRLGAMPSDDLLRHFEQVQAQIIKKMPQARPFSVEEIFRLSASNQDEKIDFSLMHTSIEALLKDSIDDLLKARAKEGLHLNEMLEQCLMQLENAVEQALPLIPLSIEQQRLKFIQKFQAASEEALLAESAIQDRLLSEITAYAIRIDIAEEVSRLQAHIQEIKQLLKEAGALGKRLDFLIQELHREANTLGSKSAHLELSRLAMDMKVTIEQMREQVQNIE